MKKILATLAAAALLLAGCSSGLVSPGGQTGTVISLTGAGAEISGGGASVKDSVVTISAAGT